MTDRDLFAAAALTGLLAAPTDKDRSMDYWARLSYEAADAMLSERAKDIQATSPPGSGQRTDKPCRQTESQSPASECGGGEPLDDTRPETKGEATGGRGHFLFLSEADVDALEYVVVEGRIACLEDYGILRSLLVKLRPEWEKVTGEPLFKK